jgi:TonB family protein
MLCGLAATAPAWSADPVPRTPHDDAAQMDAASDPAGDSLDFDIPAQPLSSALDRYAALSHRSVVFRDELVGGRISSPLSGRYTSRAALQALLAGTGLVADPGGDQSGKDAFVLKPAAAPQEPPQRAMVDRSYDALVQRGVWAALCADPRTAPGNYRTVLRFAIDDDGRLRQARLLISSGDAQRDSAMLAILAALRIDAAPPSELAQPMTLAILPRDAIAGAGYPDCRAVH